MCNDVEQLILEKRMLECKIAKLERELDQTKVTRDTDAAKLEYLLSRISQERAFGQAKLEYLLVKTEQEKVKLVDMKSNPLASLTKEEKLALY